MYEICLQPKIDRLIHIKTDCIIALMYAVDKVLVIAVEVKSCKENSANSVVKHVFHQRN